MSSTFGEVKGGDWPIKHFTQKRVIKRLDALNHHVIDSVYSIVQRPKTKISLINFTGFKFFFIHKRTLGQTM